MAKSLTGGGPQVVFELDADGEFGEAIKALKEAAWRLHMASYQLEEEYARLPPPTSRPMELGMEVGACVALAGLLGAQVEAIGTQTRRLRKRAREI